MSSKPNQKADFKIFVEGGAPNHRSLNTACRKAFGQFLERLGQQDATLRLGAWRPSIVACGSRRFAYEDFCTALKQSKNPRDVFVLLVDSEAAVSAAQSRWQHVLNRVGDGWVQPQSATDDNLFFMVECMENWFLADLEELGRYFGKGFKRVVFAQGYANIEQVAKGQVYDLLDRATKPCPREKHYSKGAHSFQVLEHITPHLVYQKSPQAKAFVDRIVQVSRS